MKTIWLVFPALLCASVAHAKSDTDVTILEAKKVEINGDQVTIVGRATTRSRVVDSDDPGDFLGRSSRWIEVLSTDATFVVNKPQLNWNGPEGEEKAKYARIIEEGWQTTLKVAKDLKAGKQAGRIGYYQPTITIDKSMIVRIEGNGYLYPGREMEEAEHGVGGQPAARPEPR